MNSVVKEFNNPVPISELEKDKILNLRFTAKTISVANAFGFAPLLHKLAESEQKFKTDPSPANKSEYMDVQIKINKMISLAMMEVSSTATEIHCYSDRIKEIVNSIRNEEINSNRRLTATSIIATAIFSIISGAVAWQTNTVQALVNVFGGLSIGAVSYKSINIESEVDYYSVKKVLKDIWYKPEQSESFSPPIWFLLNQVSQRSKGKDSLRDILVNRWKESGYLGKESSEERKKLIQLYFDENGAYNADQLDIRKEMLNEVATEINLMQQDLRNLIDEL